MRIITTTTTIALSLAALAGAARADGEAKNVIFFLGDGMGPATVTAARIYRYGEDGQLSMERLPRTAKIKTFALDAQTTDSAPSMSTYMTGVKQNNETVSMTPETISYLPTSGNTVNNCASNGPNGSPVPTVLELAKAKGKAVGAVTTTRVTHATPATTYAHICHRDLENDIAIQMVPGGAGYNPALGGGLDVLFGGGRRHYLPNTAGGARTDGRDLTAELVAQGYTYAASRAAFDAIVPATTTRAVALFTSSHMTYDLDRNPASEPSLSEMALKAIDILAKRPTGYFLLVEGGRIDHGLHDNNARRALGDAVAFDDAIRAVLSKVDLSNTLIVVTADHDHTMVINGYSKRSGPTTATNAGVLGIVKNVITGAPDLDAEGMPYSVLVFGNSDNRVSGARASAPALTDAVTSALGYHQEGGLKVTTGNESHGGGDVMLMAGGAGATRFRGTMDNTAVFGHLVRAAGLLP